jgi:outer membrane receptor for Fe3+-dicitrate
LPSLPGVLNGVGSTLNKALQNVPPVQVPNAVGNTLNNVGVGTKSGASNQTDSRSQKTLLNYLLAP